MPQTRLRSRVQRPGTRNVKGPSRRMRTKPHSSARLRSNKHNQANRKVSFHRRMSGGSLKELASNVKGIFQKSISQMTGLARRPAQALLQKVFDQMSVAKVSIAQFVAMFLKAVKEQNVLSREAMNNFRRLYKPKVASKHSAKAAHASLQGGSKLAVAISATVAALVALLAYFNPELIVKLVDALLKHIHQEMKDEMECTFGSLETQSSSKCVTRALVEVLSDLNDFFAE